MFCPYGDGSQEGSFCGKCGAQLVLEPRNEIRKHVATAVAVLLPYRVPVHKTTCPGCGYDMPHRKPIYCPGCGHLLDWLCLADERWVH